MRTSNRVALSTVLGAPLLLILLALPTAAAAASLDIKSGTPSPGDYTMRVEVSGFQLAPVQAQPVNRAGEGHIHYTLNGAPALGDYATPAKSFAFRGLENGDIVGAELVNNDHSSLSPKVSRELTVGGNDSPGLGAVGTLAVLVLALAVARRR